MGEIGGCLERLLALDRPRGGVVRTLRVGSWTLVLRGLDGRLAAGLDRRWGEFVEADAAASPTLAVDVYEGDEAATLGSWTGPEQYRLLGDVAAGRPVVRSYNFALTRDDASTGRWRVGITRSSREPELRVVENAVRYLVARLAVENGGLAVHGAALLRGDRVYVFAGPPNSGKTTVVGLSAPARSLGDDFSVLVARREGWWSAAVPFDNSEVAPARPVQDLLPLAGVWRLHQAAEHRVTVPSPVQAEASLIGCVPFHAAMPDLAEGILARVRAFVAGSRFRHLDFRRDPGFWALIDEEIRSAEGGVDC